MQLNQNIDSLNNLHKQMTIEGIRRPPNTSGDRRQKNNNMTSHC